LHEHHLGIVNDEEKHGIGVTLNSMSFMKIAELVKNLLGWCARTHTYMDMMP